jgi:hypothetical protein
MLPTGTKIKEEAFLRKHLALVALAVLAAFGLGSVLVYYQLTSSNGVSKTTDTAVSHAANEKQPGKTKPDGGSETRQHTDLKPAIYNVEIDPPDATLIVKGNQGIIAGSGRQRQIRIDRIPTDGNVVIEATCSGYQPSEEWLAPKLGEVVDLQVSLRKIPETKVETPSHVPQEVSYHFLRESDLEDFVVQGPHRIRTDGGLEFLKQAHGVSSVETRTHFSYPITIEYQVRSLADREPDRLMLGFASLTMKCPISLVQGRSYHIVLAIDAEQAFPVRLPSRNVSETWRIPKAKAHILMWIQPRQSVGMSNRLRGALAGLAPGFSLGIDVDGKAVARINDEVPGGGVNQTVPHPLFAWGSREMQANDGGYDAEMASQAILYIGRMSRAEGMSTSCQLGLMYRPDRATAKVHDSKDAAKR